VQCEIAVGVKVRIGLLIMPLSSFIKPPLTNEVQRQLFSFSSWIKYDPVLLNVLAKNGSMTFATFCHLHLGQ
jgi:hypothetical protein